MRSVQQVRGGTADAAERLPGQRGGHGAQRLWHWHMSMAHRGQPGTKDQDHAARLHCGRQEEQRLLYTELS